MNKESFRVPLLIAAVFAALGVMQEAQSFEVNVHKQITHDQLKGLVGHAGVATFTFSESGLQSIMKFNEQTDDYHISPAIFRPDLHFTNEDFVEASEGLVATRQRIIAIAKNRNAVEAIQLPYLLGVSIHTIQDFYSHSTWVESGHTTIQTVLGRGVLSNPQSSPGVCTDPNTLAPTQSYVSSAYFVGLLGPISEIGCHEDQLPAGKCFHGNYSANCIGINKDLNSQDSATKGVPFNHLHPEARRLAELATREYVQGIIDELGDDAVALQLLFGTKKPIGVVIDTTTSMSAELSGVKAQVRRMVDEDLGAPRSEWHSSYLLQKFGDPDVPAAESFADPNAFVSAVDGISLAGGGTDCPELTYTGLLSAVNAAPEGAVLVLFTDAGSKDGNLANEVSARAKQKKIGIVYALTATCASTDPEFIRTASETGGMVYRITPSQISYLDPIVNGQISPGSTYIYKEQRSVTSGQPRDVELAVDDGASNLIFSLSVPSSTASASQTVTITRPDGSQLAASQPGVTSNAFGSNYVASVATPEPGVWKARISGYGPYSAEAKLESSVVLSDFAFVEPNEDIHGGFFSTGSLPVAGQPALVKAQIQGEVQQISFSMVSDQGDLIAPITLQKGVGSSLDGDYVGEIDVPVDAFRVKAIGTAADGSSFTRITPQLYRAQNVEIEFVDSAGFEIGRGETLTTALVVKNHGAAGTFAISASAGDGITLSAPATVAVAANGEAQVQLQLSAAEDAEPLASYPLTVTAAKVGATQEHNTAFGTVQIRRALQYTELTKGQSITGLTGEQGQETIYWYRLPDGVTTGRVISASGSGDVDLYVAKGRIPSSSDNDGSSTRQGNSESINLAGAAGEVFYIKTVGKSAYGGVMLTVR